MAYVDSLISLLERLLRDYLVTVGRRGKIKTFCPAEEGKTMAGEWQFRPAKCKGTSFKEKDKCPTHVADSVTLSVFKSSLCFSEKNCFSQYK